MVVIVFCEDDDGGDDTNWPEVKIKSRIIMVEVSC